MWFYFGLSFLFLYNLCVCFSANTMLFWLLSLCIIIWSTEHNTLGLFFSPPQDCFGYSASFVALYKSDNFLFYFFEKFNCTYMGIALNLYIALSNMATLTMLILPFHELRIFFIYLSFFLYCLIMLCSFHCTDPSCNLFISRHFIFFNVKNDERTWTDTSPKNTYKWSTDIWKDAQLH